jgi:Flp pilus assembly protein TadD
MEPDNAVAYNNRGIIEAITGNLEAARKDFSRAVELKPGYEDALKNLQKVDEQLRKIGNLR